MPIVRDETDAVVSSGRIFRVSIGVWLDIGGSGGSFHDADGAGSDQEIAAALSASVSFAAVSLEVAALGGNGGLFLAGVWLLTLLTTL